MRVLWVSLSLGIALIGCSSKTNDMVAAIAVQEIVSPAAPGSRGPSLLAAGERVFLSWVERQSENHHALRYSTYEAGSWSPPLTIATGHNWFVNWADFPSMVAFGNGALAAHWLAKNGDGTYAYEVKIALATNGGSDWRQPLTPHRDGTQTEHGFVSMLPWADDRLLAVWLDGRNFAKLTNGHDHSDQDADMMLRSAVIDQNGELHDEAVLDARVCECCQTSAALTTNGAILVYRDRSAQEIRDIGVVRYQNGRWAEPRILHADNWQHPGCPVNGPAVAADGEFVAVAWYTEAQDTPHVRLAFSGDEGATFSPPIEAGDGEPMGRVDLVLLPDHSALVSWLEQTDNGGEIRLRRVRPNGRCGKSFALTPTSTQRASGFPRLVYNNHEIIFTWTQVGDPSMVRTAVARFKDDN